MDKKDWIITILTVVIIVSMLWVFIIRPIIENYKQDIIEDTVNLIAIQQNQTNNIIHINNNTLVVSNLIEICKGT